MAITFVQLAEEDPAFDLVTLLNLITLKPKQQAEKRAQLLQKQKQREEGEEDDDEEELVEMMASPLGKVAAAGKYGALIRDGVLPNAEAILAGSPQEAETIFSLVFSLLPRIPAKHLSTVVGKILPVLIASQDAAPLKIKLLTILFNILDRKSLDRHTILLALTKFALATDQSATLVGQFKGLTQWFEMWELSQEQQCELRRLIADVYVANVVDAAVQQKFLFQYLNALQGAAAAQLQEAKAHAVSAVKFALVSLAESDAENPGLQCDRLVDLDAVKALGKDKQNAKLFQLLELFAGGRVEAFSTWAKDNKAVLKDLGLDEAQILSHIRTLTICGLGSAGQRVPYATLQKALSVQSPREVESCVIDAVMSGRVQAKLDQAHEEVIILGAVQRKFQESDWEGLGDKLGHWRSMIADVLHNLGNLTQQLQRSNDPDDEEEEKQ
jgi:hypothetical protein